MSATVPFVQVDAFTDQPFAGNPAAVVLLDAWPDDALLLAIAQENNLSETAFLVPLPGDADADHHVRWYTPTAEVELCGHATLAAAHALRHHFGVATNPLRLRSRSGTLGVAFDGPRATLDFPALVATPTDPPPGLAAALGAAPRELLAGAGAAHLKLVALFHDEAAIRALAPDFAALGAIEGGCVICAAPSGDAGFVSRYFAPGFGVDEDPVTGSAHCVLAPLFASRLGRDTLHARQLSARGGAIDCRVAGDRVHLTGGAVTVIEGRLHLPAA